MPADLTSASHLILKFISSVTIISILHLKELRLKEFFFKVIPAVTTQS